MLQITKRSDALPTSKHVWMETEHKVERFRRFLPAGPLSGGGHRDEDLVQFFSVDGGLRTVRVKDLTIL